jgi:hypothetical protein
MKVSGLIIAQESAITFSWDRSKQLFLELIPLSGAEQA